MSLNGNIEGRVGLTYTKNNPDPLGNPIEDVVLTNSLAFTDTAEPSGQVYHDQNAIAVGAVQSYVLIGGSLTDEFGLSIDWNNLLGFMLEADSSNVGTITLSAGVSSVFAGDLALYPGKCVLCNSQTSLSGGLNTIHVYNSGLDSNTYNIVAIGRN